MPLRRSPGPRISPATHACPCIAFVVTDQGAEEAIIQSSASMRLQAPQTLPYFPDPPFTVSLVWKDF